MDGIRKSKKITDDFRDKLLEFMDDAGYSLEDAQALVAAIEASPEAYLNAKKPEQRFAKALSELTALRKAYTETSDDRELIGQQVGATNAEICFSMARMVESIEGKIEGGFAAMNAKFEEKFAEMDGKIDRMSARVMSVEQRMQRMDERAGVTVEPRTHVGRNGIWVSYCSTVTPGFVHKCLLPY